MGNFNCIASDSSCNSPIGTFQLGTFASSCCKQVQVEAVSPGATELESRIIQAVETVIEDRTKALVDKELRVLGVDPINIWIP